VEGFCPFKSNTDGWGLLGTLGIPLIEYVYCSLDKSVAPTGVGGVVPFALDKGEPTPVVNLFFNPLIVLFFNVFIININ
jgi:hypothetical protein